MKTVFLLLLSFAGAAFAAEPGPLRADIPAADIQRLDFKASDGEAVLKPSTDDAVHVHVALEQQEYSFLGLFHWMSESTRQDLAGATLKLTREGTALKVSVVYPSGEADSDIKQKWAVELPARLALGATMAAGRLEIDGVQGGIDAHLSAGDMTIHDPAGPLQAQMSAGRLHVIMSGTPAPGHIHLKSTFGLAALDLNGKYYGPPEQKHGFLNHLHFFGNSVDAEGGGKDAVNLKNTAGLVDLRVGPQGTEQDYRGIFAEDK